ncbi:MAG TPA: outer membrane protein assembly factor BamD [Terriglobales bacterium]|nr:outer membrane protein assembly factor BamD [Terriglobales bacterium]
MVKRFVSLVGIAVLLFGFAACHNKKVNNPIAQVDSKQPDKILFDRAMEAMKRNKFDVARLTLQTLINTYPDSEFVARAKLAVGDSWYAEGGSAALVQAENEYKDFITFFPNMPEAAEAQLKIADIHYHAMEKPDRDYTHAKRAEEEYRTLLTQWPDSALVPQAKQRLNEVQEVLAEREFRIGRFYFLRESWVAAEARLRSLVEAYPLYSGADQALYMLGQTYEKRAEGFRAMPHAPEALKGEMIRKAEDNAAAAYAKILTRYPVMSRAADAKERLQALRRPVPTPTAEAIAQNKKEEESRSETGMWGRMMGNLHKGPDVARATKVGEPQLVDPQPVSAPLILRQTNEEIMKAYQATQGGGTGKVSVETVKTGAPPPSQPVPRSDAAPTTDKPAEDNGIPELQPIQDSSQSETQAAPVTPPVQVNEVERQAESQTQPAAQPATTQSDGQAAATQTDQKSTDQKSDDKKDGFSTSKKKEKKGLRKIVPF